MKKCLILYIGLLLFGVLQGITITVDIEGNGDYISIQEGINASDDGDTILVYPGRYFENVDIAGKNITLCSLEMTTGNSEYIASTIIDGNETSSCIAICNYENNVVIRGFTITNGIGCQIGTRRRGGGIYSLNTTYAVENCLIKYNVAEQGGGIYIQGSQISLSGSTIRNNTVTKRGGGIASYFLYSSISFSSDNRCNIYNNYAPLGRDIFNCTQDEEGVETDVILDTMTVFEPFGYEFFQGDPNSLFQSYSNSEFEMLNAKLDRLDSDLFVSPDGDNNNGGVSIVEPLQTIDRAMQLISADEDNPRTIHLADGTYSQALNNQQYPITMRSYVSIIGESQENTIIDMSDALSGFIMDFVSEQGYEISNMTIRNGYADDDLSLYNRLFVLHNTQGVTNPAIFENLLIENNEYNMLYVVEDLNMIFRQVTFNNNYFVNCSCGLRYDKDNTSDRDVLLENCKFTNNNTAELYPSTSSNENITLNMNLINCEFTDNELDLNFNPISPSPVNFFGVGNIDLNIINCTFSNNSFVDPVGGAPVKFVYGTDANIINSIFYGNNTSHSIIVKGSIYELLTEMTIQYCILEDGQSSILVTEPVNITYCSESVWDNDPLFIVDGDYPYALQDNSPAIDMGTLELPEGISLPLTDLAGNPRVLGNGIDIGAYEYNPYSNPVNEEGLIYSNLLIYPNPVHINQGRRSVIINYPVSQDEAEYELSIYNIKGQRLRSLKIHNSKFKITQASWDLRDDAGDIVSSGVYFLRVSRDGEFIEQGKLTVIK